MTFAANDRRIRKLSLKVSDSAHVYGTANRIEEAFRLVTLPGENEGRNYYFRHLNLGKIRRGEDVTLLTLRLQKEFLRLMSQAVHAEDPRASASPAVYFRSSIEPLRYALHRIARGFPLDAWFFRSALPALQLTLSPAENVQLLLEASARPLGGVVHTTYLLAELLAHGELEPLLPLITVETAELFLSALSQTYFPVPAVPKTWTKLIEQALPRTLDAEMSHRIIELLNRGEFESVSSLLSPDVAEQVISAFTRMYSPPGIPTIWANLIRKALRLWGATDQRTLWMAVSALVSEAPARVSDPDLLYKAQTIILRIAVGGCPFVPIRVAQRNALPSSIASTSAAEDCACTPESQRPANKLEAADDVELQSSDTGNAKAAEDTELQPSAIAKTDLRRAQPTPDRAAAKKAGSASPTTHAGFYFLLHALRHLGIAEFLERHPKLLDVNFPWILLRALAAHVDMAEDDPLLSCATEIPGHASGHKFSLTIPAQWNEIFPKAKFDQPVEHTAGALARLWVVAVHRWLWRFGELRMADVVRRRGTVSYERPQIDITLLLHGVDIRIRRLGLDVDPAWVAWLGLIVRFHYEQNLGDAYGASHN